MFISDIIHHLESVAPPAYQESYDNSGLIIGSSSWVCNGILVCLDATEAVIQDAANNNCNLVVAHHPIVFAGLKRFSTDTYVGRAVIAAIKQDIAIYAIHTNLDNVLHGVNGKMADILGLRDRQVLLPKQDILMKPADTNPSTGSGLIGHLPEPMEAGDFFTLLKSQFRLKVIKHTPLLPGKIGKLALCGGAGSFLISRALAAGAHLFLSSDIKYHEFFDANDRMVIADIGHYESEQFTIELLSGILQEKFPTFAVLKTGVETNPVRYFL